LMFAQIRRHGQVIAIAQATRVREPYLAGSVGKDLFVSYVRSFTGGEPTKSDTVAGKPVLRASRFRGVKLDVIAWKQPPFVISFVGQPGRRAQLDTVVTYVMRHLKA
jgi:hypothetical protein